MSAVPSQSIRYLHPLDSLCLKRQYTAFKSKDSLITTAAHNHGFVEKDTPFAHYLVFI